MSEEQLFTVGPASPRSAVVKKRDKGSFPGTVICTVVKEGLIHNMLWREGTIPHVREKELEPYTATQTELPGMEGK